jgi:aminoglycoside phosphotransferase (APT) family kinase protein
MVTLAYTTLFGDAHQPARPPHTGNSAPRNIFFLGASWPRSPLAVLDWELSTIGDPWADVAYMCMCFQNFGDSTVPILPQALPDAAKGVPSQSDILRRYCSARGETVPQDFHM